MAAFATSCKLTGTWLARCTAVQESTWSLVGRLAAIAIVALLVLGFRTGIGFTLIPPVFSTRRAPGIVAMATVFTSGEV
jgi:predicted exporter